MSTEPLKNRAEMMREVAAELLLFDEKNKVGSVTIHIGPGVYELEVNGKGVKFVRDVPAKTVKPVKWK